MDDLHTGDLLIDLDLPIITIGVAVGAAGGTAAVAIAGGGGNDTTQGRSDLKRGE